MNIKVFTSIVGFVFNVPDPSIFKGLSLILPQVLIVDMRRHLLRVSPELRNVSIITSANRTTFTLTDSPHDSKLALLIYVQPNDPEVFGLDQFLQDGSSSFMHRF